MHSARFSFEAIGTSWLIDCYEITSAITENDLLKCITARTEEFDRIYSRFRSDSLVWEISQKSGKFKFPADAEKFFQFYNNFNKITEGKFTLLIGNALSDAGYDSSYSLKSKHIRQVPESETVYVYNHPILDIKTPTILDFGGLGKGYLIDIICEILRDSGVRSFCVDGGGDIFYESHQNKSLTVGLENPINTKEVIGTIEIKNQSICASSGNRRKWGEYHHIFDPHKLNSPQDVLATWVIASEAIIADGIATSLFMMKPEKFKKYFSFEYLILFSDMTFEKSSGFNSKLFLKSKK